MMSTYNMTIANPAIAPRGAWPDCPPPLDPPLLPDDIFSRLDTIHERDGQSDARQTDTGRQQELRLRTVSCLLYIRLLRMEVQRTG